MYTNIKRNSAAGWSVYGIFKAVERRCARVMKLRWTNCQDICHLKGWAHRLLRALAIASANGSGGSFEALTGS